MNNAKVRIYDLSKELNLENREIIEICEYLNIPVKSHSSTITEDEAVRIKSTAEKHGGAIHKGVAESAQDRGKQQILAVHHKQPRSAETAKSADLPSPTKPLQPKPTLVSPSSLSVQPTLDKPQRPASATESTSPDALPLTAPSSKTKENAREDKPKKSELLEPPSRLTSKSASDPLSKPSVQTGSSGIEPKDKEKEISELKPLPKKARKETQEETGEDQDNRQKKPQKIKPIAAEVELKRPQPPQKEIPALAKSPTQDATVAEPAENEDQEDTIDTELPPSHKKAKSKQKLKRPTLPSPTKGAGWEEDDDQEVKSKIGSKNKRLKPIIDDDDDFEDDLSDNEATNSFSLSTARPPKPKSGNKPPAPTNKPKKAPVKATQVDRRQRSERRERKERVRPESIIIQGNLTIRELADLIQVPETDIIKNLFFKGIAVNITQTLELEIAQQVAEDFEIAVESPEEKAAATKSTEMLDVEDLDHLQRRPPVVTIMGHVDHGKTTLLDSIRKTKVAQGEAGGITQHIGAYHVDTDHNGESQQIVFLDTPGHEAFTAMRARGAKVTDIAILVVAADDGVQPQTREAISHARAAEVPLIVAINKVDKHESNPDRIKQELSELGLVPEEWGGETIMVPVSALKGDNLDNLLEMILLVSDIEELSANPDRLARGTVIEAHLDRARGPVATLLVQNGTLMVGDIIVAGAVMGKIRAMIDDRGEKVEAASPSFAVEVLGLSEVPAAGDEFEVFSLEKEAKAIADQRSIADRESRLQKAMSGRRISLSTLSAQAQEGELKELNLILKADVQGSVEAIIGSLEQLPQEEVQIRILLAAPGEITETDVDLASASGAVVIGFSTTLASGARAAADREGVDIREYDVIYKLLDDIQGAMEGLLDPEEVESSLGQAEVRAVFPVGRGTVAGCYVQSGKIIRNRLMRVRRKGEVIFEGVIDSLKRMKEDAREVNAGYECGIGSSKFTDWQESDVIEAYEMVMKRRTLAGK